jgi:hypothetical protein
MHEENSKKIHQEIESNKKETAQSLNDLETRVSSEIKSEITPLHSLTQKYSSQFNDLKIQVENISSNT